ncbi:deoxyribose-phosphate aldolase (plasmid) [Paroceanicella profunda]|uniref:Deoxyribose-phosphate aldolase n=1 Tax=Paroceanicella profunda TaxID=2579971 RepID=A0A5B8G2L9_9RHOB|nr:deoxyribose-phosphate aldolase [Paroceanicella profunda]QDL94150.1 deoxyribose-phosphate aldolase [Paroceanicella profunda]
MTPEIAATRALACLDLTNLEDGCTGDDIAALCARADTRHGPVAAVCIWPKFVAQAKGLLSLSTVRVATVVNFPGGDAPASEVMAMTEEAVADGADEIDMVIPYRHLMEGEPEAVRAMVERVKSCAGQATVKAILETGILNDDAMISRAAALAIDGGADFIKTSTGKIPMNATHRAVRLMLEAVAEHDNRLIGVKPSGGVRTLEDATSYLDIADEVMGADWVSPLTFRFGASSLLDALLATLAGRLPADDGITGGY